MTDNLVKRLRERGGRIPTEAADRIEALEALLKEARQDLEVYVTNEYPKDKHPYYERQWNRDMELCRRIDAALIPEGNSK